MVRPLTEEEPEEISSKIQPKRIPSPEKVVKKEPRGQTPGKTVKKEPRDQTPEPAPGSAPLVSSYLAVLYLAVAVLCRQAQTIRPQRHEVLTGCKSRCGQLFKCSQLPANNKRLVTAQTPSWVTTSLV
ncbi:hypothetical protein QBC39DRAFT_328859 [Podospora conica]|nr:hypothetical protein QBC39DRAFT_328859 [Schizothecium conicum]